jgi:hypothetical protein
MGVIKRGILGGFANKVGNVVGSSWKGIATMRTLPLSVANPKSSGQTEQRDKFSTASKLGSLLLATICKPLWDRFAKQESGFNAFIKQNVELCTPESVDVENLLMSKGSLAPSSILTKSMSASANTITLTWDTTPAGDANPSDLAFISVMEITFPNNLKTQGFQTNVARSVGTATVTADFDVIALENYQVYLMFKKADGTKVSNSVNDLVVAS